MQLPPGSKSMIQTGEDFRAIGLRSMESMHPHFIRDQKLSHEHQSIGAERMASLSVNSWKTTEQGPGPQPNLHFHSASLCMEGHKNNFQYENGLFSSSLSEIFSRKCKLFSPSVVQHFKLVRCKLVTPANLFFAVRLSSDAFVSQSTNTVDLNLREDEPFELSEEIEAQTIGDLLPGDDELLSGVVDDIEYNYQPNNGDDAEDDLFCSLGGIELDNDDNLNSKDPANGVPNSQQGVLGVPFAGEHPYGEHPSRTLFVRNINSNVDDSELRTLFEVINLIISIFFNDIFLRMKF